MAVPSMAKGPRLLHLSLADSCSQIVSWAMTWVVVAPTELPRAQSWGSTRPSEFCLFSFPGDDGSLLEHWVGRVAVAMVLPFGLIDERDALEMQQMPADFWESTEDSDRAWLSPAPCLRPLR